MAVPQGDWILAAIGDVNRVGEGKLLVVFAEVPDAWALAGGALIVASGIYVVGGGPPRPLE